MATETLNPLKTKMTAPCFSMFEPNEVGDGDIPTIPFPFSRPKGTLLGVNESTNAEGSGGEAQSTSWTLIGDAGKGCEKAWTRLVRLYSKPVLAHLRRKGASQHDAEDLLQTLLYNWVQNQALNRDWTDKRKGRFRSFLFFSVNNLLASKFRRERAESHGGGRVKSLDAEMEGGQSLGATIAGGSKPDDEFRKAFDSDWWKTILEHATASLTAKARNSKHAPLIPLLLPVLYGDSSNPDYREIAARFSMTEETIRKAAERLRAHLRKEIRLKILETCRPENFEEELDYFLSLGLASSRQDCRHQEEGIVGSNRRQI